MLLAVEEKRFVAARGHNVQAAQFGGVLLVKQHFPAVAYFLQQLHYALEHVLGQQVERWDGTEKIEAVIHW